MGVAGVVVGRESQPPFMTDPAGSAIVNATGAIRQVVHGEDNIRRRNLVIAEAHPAKHDPVVQVQLK
jgi:hypothetical protein